MSPNKKCQFIDLRPGDIFLDDIYGSYFMVIPERWEHNRIANALYVDGRVGGNQCGSSVHFDFTDDVLYVGTLGVNWFPDRF